MFKIFLIKIQKCFHKSLHKLFLGGCDGCVNIDNESNNGLADLIADLEDIYQDNDFENVLSR